MIRRILDRLRPNGTSFVLDPEKYERLVPFGRRDGFFVGRDRRLQRTCLFHVLRSPEVESRVNVENVWPQSMEVGGTCSTCVYLSSLEHFGENCSAASFVFAPDDGSSLKDLTVMVPMSSKKAARDYAEQAIRVIGPPADSLVDKESDPWSRYYTWSSREDCGPHPEGCVLSMLEVGYEQYPGETFWTLIIQWTRISLD